jgi:peptidoglycan/LPS O-acetylase OafA/YrhL
MPRRRRALLATTVVGNLVLAAILLASAARVGQPSFALGMATLTPATLAGGALLTDRRKRLWRRAVEAESLDRVADELRDLVGGFDHFDR